MSGYVPNLNLTSYQNVSAPVMITYVPNLNLSSYQNVSDPVMITYVPNLNLSSYQNVSDPNLNLTSYQNVSDPIHERLRTKFKPTSLSKLILTKLNPKSFINNKFEPQQERRSRMEYYTLIKS